LKKTRLKIPVPIKSQLSRQRIFNNLGSILKITAVISTAANNTRRATICSGEKPQAVKNLKKRAISPHKLAPEMIDI
jgi:hypothetical protein